MVCLGTNYKCRMTIQKCGAGRDTCSIAVINTDCYFFFDTKFCETRLYIVLTPLSQDHILSSNVIFLFKPAVEHTERQVSTRKRMQLTSKFSLYITTLFNLKASLLQEL